jgi:putative DNA primase/helicase
MTPETIAKALGGHRAGATWMAKCPAHEDRNPSLSISLGDHRKVLLHCFAGCAQCDVISALVDRGLWDAKVEKFGRFSPKRETPTIVEPDANARARSEAALSIWRASHVGNGTPVETYLRSRGLVSMAEKKCARWRGISVPVWLIKKGGDAHGVVCLT